MPDLIVVDYAGSASGIRRFLQTLVEGLLDISEFAGWRIEVATPAIDYHGHPVEWTANGNSRVAFRREGDARESHRPEDFRSWIESVVAERSSDVAYFPSPYLAACPDLEVPMTATFHDFNYKHFETWSAEIRDDVEKQLPGWLAKAVPVVSSRFIAQELMSYHPELSGRVRLVALGVGPGPEWTEEQWSDFAARHRIPEQFIVTPGWLAPHKNQVLLLEALGVLKQEGIDLCSVFVGPNTAQLADLVATADPYARHMIHVARRLELDHGKHFLGLGEVTDRELQMLYAHAQAMVMPTLYESVGLPVPEAMRAGCPVVCSAIPALEEVILRVGPGAARTFNPYDPISLAAALTADLHDHGGSLARATAAIGPAAIAFDPSSTARGYARAFVEAAAG